MTWPSRVLVTGGTGAIGPTLVRRLLDEGSAVRVLSRGRTPGSAPEDGVERVLGDIADRERLRAAVQGCDCVFHLAALLHVAGFPAALRAEYERVNAEGTRVVVEEAERAGVARLLVFSTISVYGPTGSEPADEETPPAPRDLYAASKLHAETIALGHAGALAVSVLRLAAVYGRGVKGNYAALARAIRSGWFVPIGAGENRRTLVHESDVAAAALVVARSPRAAGRIYNVSDGSVHRLREIEAAIYAACGRSRPRVSLPAAPLRAAATLGDFLLSLAGRRERARALLDKYQEDVAVRAERIERELGFTAAVGLAEGWRDALCR